MASCWLNVVQQVTIIITKIKSNPKATELWKRSRIRAGLLDTMALNSVIAQLLQYYRETEFHKKKRKA